MLKNFPEDFHFQTGKIKAKAVRGDPHLGGPDIDNWMLSFCVQWLKEKYNRDLNRSVRALRRLRLECMRKSKEKSVFCSIDCDRYYSLYEGIDSHIMITRRLWRGEFTENGGVALTFYIRVLKTDATNNIRSRLK